MNSEDLKASLDTVELANVAADTRDAPHLHVVGVSNLRPCNSGSIIHPGDLVLEDGTRLNDGDAIAMIDAGRVLYMIPPSGAPAHAAAAFLDARLLLQVRICGGCGQRVLFA